MLLLAALSALADSGGVQELTLRYEGYPDRRPDLRCPLPAP